MIVKTLRFLKTNTTHFKVHQILNFSQRPSSRELHKIDPYPSKYGGKTIVTVLPGVGIGPEIMSSTLEILEAADAPLTYEIVTLSNTHVPEEFEGVVKSIRRNKVSLKGNIDFHTKDLHAPARNTLLRKVLDAYVYIVKCQSYPGLVNKFGKIDMTLIRQNTEGEYLMLEHEPTPHSVEFLKVVTESNIVRLAEFAFKYAQENKKKEVTVAHNADVQFYAEGLFVDAVGRISKNYPGVKVNFLNIGVLIFEMVKNPRLFEIILATNLNGSMLTNFLSGMLGGPSLCAGVNFSEDGIALFEPGVRNRGSSIVGKGIANPLAMVMAAIDMLIYLKLEKTAEIIKNSVFATLILDKIQTPDLGGKSTTKEFTEGVIKNITKQFSMSRKTVVFSGETKIIPICSPPPPKDEETV